MTKIAALAFAFFVSLILTGLLSRWHGSKVAIDHPGARSLHLQPTPRLGGVAIIVGLMAGLACLTLTGTTTLPLFYFALPVAGISLFEDIRSLPPLLRLCVHAAAAFFVAIQYINITLIFAPDVSVTCGWMTVVCLIIAIVWMTNLYNFMDGMDGLAASMSVIGFGALGLACLSTGANDLCAQAWIIAAATGGFLVWNIPPARIFMGDTGSTVLGFLAASLSLEAAVRAAVPLWFPALVFSPFWVDATITVFRRLFRGEYIWLAHRDHYYQQLVILCNGRHAPILIAESAVMLACSASGIIALYSQREWLQWLVISSWCLIYLLFAFLFRGTNRAQ